MKIGIVCGRTSQGLTIIESIARVMLYFGPAGYPEGSKSPIDALETVHRLGLNALEVQFVRQARMEERKARSFGGRAEELGILLSAHAPYYINFNSANRTTVNKSVEWILRTARIADQMGAWVIVFHAASYSGKSPRRATNAVIRGLQRCKELMDEEGLNSKMGLETMGKKGTWGTLPEIGEVVKVVEGVIPVVDFGHIHARSNGRFGSAADFHEIIDEVEAIDDDHMHCHFSCIEYTDAGEKRHLPLAAKDPDFSFLAEVLVGIHRDATVISETPLLEKDALRMKSMVGSI